MSAIKEDLKKVIGELSEDESRIILKFAEWLREQKEELTDKELAILHRGEQQIREGDFVWWRDVKRTNVLPIWNPSLSPGPSIKPLKGMTGKYRYRIGNLRVVYEIDSAKRIVYVLAILPRGQAYK